SPGEQKIMRVWAKLFQSQQISINDNFFLELGGHSLLAARMVSELRRDPEFTHVSLADVYENPTVALLAQRLEPANSAATKTQTTSSSRQPSQEDNIPKSNFGAGIVQSILLYFVFGLRALEWTTPYLVFFGLLFSGRSLLFSLAATAISS